MYRVVLTGGIASGKTAATRHFQRLGVIVVDTDQISREIVQPGEPALHEIVRLFGEDVLTARGTLDRQVMRQRIFAAPEQRTALESVLHPLIRQRAYELLEQTTSVYSVLAVPLFLEHRQDYPCERVLVIDAPEELQRQRLAERDGSTPEDIQRILDAQATRAQRLAVADDVILNDGSLSALHTAVENLHRRYMTLATGFLPPLVLQE